MHEDADTLTDHSRSVEDCAWRDPAPEKDEACHQNFRSGIEQVLRKLVDSSAEVLV